MLETAVWQPSVRTFVEDDPSVLTMVSMYRKKPSTALRIAKRVLELNYFVLNSRYNWIMNLTSSSSMLCSLGLLMSNNRKLIDYLYIIYQEFVALSPFACQVDLLHK